VTGGATVLLTTQYLEEAEALADQIVVFDHGRVVADGTSDELKEKIGGQTLAVRATDRSRTPEVTTIVARITGASPEVNDDTGLVTAPLDDPALLTGVVRELDAAGIVAAELALRRPSLDEVFLSLTGHSAEGSAE
jgi:oleandomycin transport system ATP-binding protein